MHAQTRLRGAENETYLPDEIQDECVFFCLLLTVEPI